MTWRRQEPGRDINSCWEMGQVIQWKDITIKGYSMKLISFFMTIYQFLLFWIKNRKVLWNTSIVDEQKSWHDFSIGIVQEFYFVVLWWLNVICSCYAQLWYELAAMIWILVFIWNHYEISIKNFDLSFRMEIWWLFVGNFSIYYFTWGISINFSYGIANLISHFQYMNMNFSEYTCTLISAVLSWHVRTVMYLLRQ